MLSYKTTHAIQILDLLQRSKDGLSVTDIRKRFLFLPAGTIISQIVRQLVIARFIGNIPASSSRYQVLANLDDITLETLTRAVDEKPVLGAPVGFHYWQPNYLKARPRIQKIEQELSDQLTRILKSITVGELLKQPDKKGKPNPDARPFHSHKSLIIEIIQ